MQTYILADEILTRGGKREAQSSHQTLQIVKKNSWSPLPGLVQICLQIAVKSVIVWQVVCVNNFVARCKSVSGSCY